MAHFRAQCALRAALVITLASLAAPALAGDRTITFVNHCSFDVWMTSVGSNAGTVPCSPSSSNAQGNCPAGNVCYSPDANTHYCVPGTTRATSFPVTEPRQIALDPSLCTSGAVVTDPGSTLWGQCECSGNADCASGQICKQAAKGIQQCYWQLDLPDGGLVAQGGKPIHVPVSVHSTEPHALVASGKFYAKLACNENGVCLSDNSAGAPASLVEFTFQNDMDWYDVSYINGVNVPMAMYPVPSTANDYQAGDPYRCQAAGGDAGIYQAITRFQTSHGLKPNTALQGFVCTNDYANTFTGDQAGFNFVSEDAGAATCSPTDPCTGQGQVCGLTLATVTAGGTQTRCGHRLGYWTYAQFCAAPASPRYSNAALGIACDDTSTYAYALCKNQPGLADTGPSRSCFNSTTSSGDTCCGYEAWTKGGKAQPMGKGDSAVPGVVTSDWKSAVLPQVRAIKEGCHLAYSYQFDDPFSTFTCASESGLNAVSYQVELCPSGNTAGIQPPAATSCQPQVPSGYDSDELTIGIGDPDHHSYAVTLCDDTKNTCDTPVKPTATNIYTAAAGTHTYQVTAKNTSTATTQSCKFRIPQTGCIAAVDRSGDCATWSVATTGAWTGRSIQIPAF